MKCLIVAKDNGYGLSTHSELLHDALVKLGHDVSCVEPRNRPFLQRFFGRTEYDIAIHVERIGKAWLNAARYHILLPQQERYPKRLVGLLRKIDCVFAQTRHAEAVFAGLNIRTVFTGYTSRDRYQPEIKKNWARFFHLAGGSTLKGTEDILTAWADHPDWPELVLVQKKANAPKTVSANVTLFSGHLSDDELRILQNQCGIHLCPSRSEGWGHYLHEAMSCGAVVLTTDAPPMNEFITQESGILVPFARAEPRHLGINYFFDRTKFAEAVEQICDSEPKQREAMSIEARRRFVKAKADFQVQLARVLQNVQNGLEKQA